MRSGVKRKYGDQEGTLSRSGLGNKLRPHKSWVLIHAIFALMIKELLGDVLILNHGSLLLDPCEIIFRFSHPFLAVPWLSLSRSHACEG